MVRDPAVLDSGDRVNAEVLARMLDEAVTTLLGETDPQPAWRLLFKPSDVVGIKSNVWERLPTP
ncbi:MAG: hypothetical protein GTN93_33085, partial [Anaerolineae bacterium]|nr:hypothetical protein [Anaerolineae bacterium]